jgi:hypothetical protein
MKMAKQLVCRRCGEEARQLFNALGARQICGECCDQLRDEEDDAAFQDAQERNAENNRDIKKQ